MSNEPNQYGRHGMRETNPVKATNRINFYRLSIRPGEFTVMEIGYSEVACHMGIAGKLMWVMLLEDGKMAQLYDGDVNSNSAGCKFSMPITYGEAGIYKDAAGYYHH